MGRHALTAGGVASVALACVLAGSASGADPFDAMRVLRPSAPESAPDVAFTTLGGAEVRVRDSRGRPVLLGFFTTS